MNLQAERVATRNHYTAAVMREVERYLHTHYGQDVFLRQIAEDANYSYVYFSKLFREHFHMSFPRYLTDLRIEAAKRQLLNPAASIREVSDNVGYPDPNYFAKVFRRLVGQTPSCYRCSCLAPGERRL